MKTGFAISIFLHAALLAWAVVKITTPRDFKVNEIKTVAVDFTTVDDLTRIKAGRKDAKKAPHKPKKTEKPKPKAKKVAKPKPKAALPPKPKKVALPPKPKKKAKPKPKPKKLAKKSPPKKPLPKKRPARKKPKKKPFDPDKISALLNKLPNAQPQPTEAAKKPKPKPAPKPQGRGRPDGQHARMTMNEVDAFRAQISQCWNPPVGGLGADRLVVRMRLKLKKDGTLSSVPQVINSQASPFFAAASDAAMRAVLQCQPYEMPAQKYAVWRDMILNFDPREMFQ